MHSNHEHDDDMDTDTNGDSSYRKSQRRARRQRQKIAVQALVGILASGKNNFFEQDATDAVAVADHLMERLEQTEPGSLCLRSDPPIRGFETQALIEELLCRGNELGNADLVKHLREARK